ncbi:hypothetical protein STRIP9103_02511, partial [Streptomyces ipomoeae 91-03]
MLEPLTAHPSGPLTAHLSG